MRVEDRTCEKFVVVTLKTISDYGGGFLYFSKLVLSLLRVHGVFNTVIVYRVTTVCLVHK